eukprot:753042-Hanusia_phi.AAC.2
MHGRSGMSIEEISSLVESFGREELINVEILSVDGRSKFVLLNLTARDSSHSSQNFMSQDKAARRPTLTGSNESQVQDSGLANMMTKLVRLQKFVKKKPMISAFEAWIQKTHELIRVREVCNRIIHRMKGSSSARYFMLWMYITREQIRIREWYAQHEEKIRSKRQASLGSDVFSLWRLGSAASNPWGLIFSWQLDLTELEVVITAIHYGKERRSPNEECLVGLDFPPLEGMMVRLSSQGRSVLNEMNFRMHGEEGAGVVVHAGDGEVVDVRWINSGRIKSYCTGHNFQFWLTAVTVSRSTRSVSENLHRMLQLPKLPSWTMGPYEGDEKGLRLPDGCSADEERIMQYVKARLIRDCYDRQKSSSLLQSFCVAQMCRRRYLQIVRTVSVLQRFVSSCSTRFMVQLPLLFEARAKKRAKSARLLQASLRAEMASRHLVKLRAIANAVVQRHTFMERRTSAKALTRACSRALVQVLTKDIILVERAFEMIAKSALRMIGQKRHAELVRSALILEASARAHKGRSEFQRSTSAASLLQAMVQRVFASRQYCEWWVAEAVNRLVASVASSCATIMQAGVRMRLALDRQEQQRVSVEFLSVCLVRTKFRLQWLNIVRAAVRLQASCNFALNRIGEDGIRFLSRFLWRRVRRTMLLCRLQGALRMSTASVEHEARRWGARRLQARIRRMVYSQRHALRVRGGYKSVAKVWPAELLQSCARRMLTPRPLLKWSLMNPHSVMRVLQAAARRTTRRRRYSLWFSSSLSLQACLRCRLIRLHFLSARLWCERKQVPFDRLFSRVVGHSVGRERLRVQVGKQQGMWMTEVPLMRERARSLLGTEAVGETLMQTVERSGRVDDAQFTCLLPAIPRTSLPLQVRAVKRSLMKQRLPFLHVPRDSSIVRSLREQEADGDRRSYREREQGKLARALLDGQESQILHCELSMAERLQEKMQSSMLEEEESRLKQTRTLSQTVTFMPQKPIRTRSPAFFHPRRRISHPNHLGMEQARRQDGEDGQDGEKYEEQQDSEEEQIEEQKKEEEEEEEEEEEVRPSSATIRYNALKKRRLQIQREAEEAKERRLKWLLAELEQQQTGQQLMVKHGQVIKYLAEAEIVEERMRGMLRRGANVTLLLRLSELVQEKRAEAMRLSAAIKIQRWFHARVKGWRERKERREEEINAARGRTALMRTRQWLEQHKGDETGRGGLSLVNIRRSKMNHARITRNAPTVRKRAAAKLQAAVRMEQRRSEFIESFSSLTFRRLLFSIVTIQSACRRLLLQLHARKLAPAVVVLQGKIRCFLERDAYHESVRKMIAHETFLEKTEAAKTLQARMKRQLMRLRKEEEKIRFESAMRIGDRIITYESIFQ